MLSNEFLLKGVAAPLVVAFAATLVSWRLTTGRRGVAAIGLIAGEALGLALAAWGEKDWFPHRNSDWVGWVTLASAVVGPMVVSSGLTQFERWLLAGLTSLGAAALIVPTWPDLWPSRWISMLSVVGVFTIVARGCEGVARRTPPRLVVVALACSAVTATFLIGACVSFTLAQPALILAAAFTGVTMAMLCVPDETAVSGIGLPYAVGVGGFCYVSAIELPPPAPMLLGLLFVPLAPLVLWLIAIGPLAKKGLRARWGLGLLLVLVSLLAVALWTWNSTASGVDEYEYVQE